MGSVTASLRSSDSHESFSIGWNPGKRRNCFGKEQIFSKDPILITILYLYKLLRITCGGNDLVIKSEQQREANLEQK